jgi:hypothetical protein
VAQPARQVVDLPVPAVEERGVVRAEWNHSPIRARHPFTGRFALADDFPQALEFAAPAIGIGAVQAHPEIDVRRHLARFEQHRNDPVVVGDVGVRGQQFGEDRPLVRQERR